MVGVAGSGRRHDGCVRSGSWCHPEGCRSGVPSSPTPRNSDLKSGTEWEQEPEAVLGSERPGQKRAVGMAQPRAQPTAPWAAGDNKVPWEQVQQPELWWEGRFGWAGVCEADPSCGHSVTGRPWLASPACPPQAPGLGWAVTRWLRNTSSTHVHPARALQGTVMSSCGCTLCDVLLACPVGCSPVQHMNSVPLISPKEEGSGSD